MNTILKLSVELEELVGRKWQMAPNRMFQQLTDKTKKKKKHRPFYEAVDAHARRRLIKVGMEKNLYISFEIMPPAIYCPNATRSSWSINYSH